MATIPVTPFVMKNALVTLGANDFQAACSRARFDPNVARNTQKWKGLAPNAKFSETTQDAAEWTLALAVAQDWENAGSLANYLLEHEGEEVACVFEPIAGGQAFEATITLVPPSIGADVDAYAVSEVVMASTAPVPSAP